MHCNIDVRENVLKQGQVFGVDRLRWYVLNS